jgi:hypothetical protein
MNEFIGTDRSAALWYGSKRRAAKDEPKAAQQTPETAASDAGEMSIEVWLFGLLSALTTERPVTLRLPGNATTMDVVAALEDRFGSEILGRIRDPVSGILASCKSFVDGEPIEDVTAPISAGRKSAKVELILLKGFEGG